MPGRGNKRTRGAPAGSSSSSAGVVPASSNTDSSTSTSDNKVRVPLPEDPDPLSIMLDFAKKTKGRAFAQKLDKQFSKQDPRLMEDCIQSCASLAHFLHKAKGRKSPDELPRGQTGKKTEEEKPEEKEPSVGSPSEMEGHQPAPTDDGEATTDGGATTEATIIDAAGDAPGSASAKISSFPARNGKGTGKAEVKSAKKGVRITGSQMRAMIAFSVKGKQSGQNKSLVAQTKKSPAPEDKNASPSPSGAESSTAIPSTAQGVICFPGGNRSSPGEDRFPQSLSNQNTTETSTGDEAATDGTITDGVTTGEAVTDATGEAVTEATSTDSTGEGATVNTGDAATDATTDAAADTTGVGASTSFSPARLGKSISAKQGAANLKFWNKYGVRFRMSAPQMSAVVALSSVLKFSLHGCLATARKRCQTILETSAVVACRGAKDKRGRGKKGDHFPPGLADADIARLLAHTLDEKVIALTTSSSKDLNRLGEELLRSPTMLEWYYRSLKFTV